MAPQVEGREAAVRIRKYRTRSHSRRVGRFGAAGRDLFRRPRSIRRPGAVFQARVLPEVKLRCCRSKCACCGSVQVMLCYLRQDKNVRDEPY